MLKCGFNKLLSLLHECESQTDRQTDGRTDANVVPYTALAQHR